MTRHQDEANDPAKPAEKFHSCAECHAVYPEKMLCPRAGLWLCGLCEARISESPEKRKERERYGHGFGLGFRGTPLWVQIFLGSTLGLVLLMRMIVFSWATRSSSLAPTTTEGWMTKSDKGWPPIVLVNDVKFRGFPKSAGGTGFLIEQEDGRILGATGALRKLLGNEEDEPSPTNGEINAQLVSWRMQTRNAPSRALAFRGLHGVPAEHSDGDVWMLETDAAKSPLPVTPLKIRPTPLAPGLRMFVVATLADDPTGTQRIFPCTVRSSALRGELTELAFDRPVVALGFRGAPVVDGHGHLAGIVIGPGETPREDGAVIAISAVGVAGLQRLAQ